MRTRNQASGDRSQGGRHSRTLLFSLLFFLSPISCLLFPIFAQEPYGQSQISSAELNKKLSDHISLDLRKIDVLDVLKFFSTKAGLNFVTSQNVNAKVTLFLKDVTISNALEIILISTGLAIREKEGVLYVMTEEEYTALYGESYRDQREIKIVEVKYTSPDKVGEILGGLKSSIGKIIIDAQTGTLVLIDTREKIELMDKMVAKLDIPTVERIIPTETKIFELSYNKAADLQPQAQVLLTQGVGRLQADEKTNRLVVTDFPHAIERIQTLIEAFDRKTREVYIETKMVQVRLSNDYEMGIEWEAIINQGPERNKFRINNAGTFPISANTSRFTRTIIGDLGREDIQATIDMLHEFGDAKTLASPQITVEHGKEATILVGTREAYVTSTVSQADASTTTSESITFVDVGVQLKVTPEINQDGYVSMKISPEVSAVGREITTANGNTIPIVDTTNASTQVTVKSGRTVLIGGLMKDDLSKTVDKFPLLGDIPFFGALFRYTTDSKTKTELVIFLTPRIVEGNELLPFSDTASAKRFESLKVMKDMGPDIPTPALDETPHSMRELEEQVRDRITKLRTRTAG